MKRISRMFVFSAVALSTTTLWNKGFTLSHDVKNFLIATVAVAILYYLLIPLSKVLLFPLNFITFGLFSVAVNSLLFYLMVAHFSAIISIKEWSMPHIHFLFVNIGPAYFGTLANTVICALAIYIVINFLEWIL